MQMADTVVVVGTDLTAEERAQVDEAAQRCSLVSEHFSDFRRAYEAMQRDMPTLVVAAKAMDGACDAFALLGALQALAVRGGELASAPVVLLGPAPDFYIHAAWGAGVECYLTRPFSTDELGVFIARVLDRPIPEQAL